MRVSELSGAALDRQVANIDERCNGLTWEWRENHWAGVCDDGVAVIITDAGPRAKLRLCRLYGCDEYKPSRSWSHGGPLLDKYDIMFDRFPDDKNTILASCGPHSALDVGEWQRGQGRLQAACRAIVASVYGDSVPDEVATESLAVSA